MFREFIRTGKALRIRRRNNLLLLKNWPTYTLGGYRGSFCATSMLETAIVRLHKNPTHDTQVPTQMRQACPANQEM